MGRVREDKLGALSEAGGTISLGASSVRIGGQQYKTTIALNIAVPTVTVNSLQFVYLVLNAGVPELKISTAVNSIGPGESSWKLVGAYYADDSGAFGAFVTIEGSPESGWITTTLTIDAIPTPPTKGVIARDIFSYKRDGSNLEVFIDFKQSGAGVNGTGIYTFPLPLGWSLNTDTLEFDVTQEEGGTIGSAQVFNNSLGVVKMYTATEMSMIVHVGGGGAHINSGGTGALSNAGMTFSGNGVIPIAEFNNTPLKDL